MWRLRTSSGSTKVRLASVCQGHCGWCRRGLEPASAIDTHNGHSRSDFATARKSMDQENANRHQICRAGAEKCAR